MQNININPNIINQVEVKYLRPSRTIEELELSNNGNKETCFVYNYEGNLFYYFDNKKSLSEFLKQNDYSKIPFENETDLDHFLLTKTIGI
ncbi:hypothetical protein [Ancylomarina sp. 16SWW S1-10-2]|uniref:hypothetical protein n=1 Tax=Ancylomarina sp. 16SWW S1-10-2 TaxID=2499681 RepID=UPI0012AE008A|nr:hypothetical protein [Ancylomarina sp. 16SWW S1-10-2]MRT91727.1 hypothetical protein [Ancylomarina sp. 16SWW S1-10-2]